MSPTLGEEGHQFEGGDAQREAEQEDARTDPTGSSSRSELHVVNGDNRQKSFPVEAEAKRSFASCELAEANKTS